MRSHATTPRSYCTAKADVGVKGGGKWYHEVTLDTNSQMLLGFVTGGCNMEPNNGQGLGSDALSWGWDGYNAQRVSGGKTESYGERQWKVGDVIGVLLDLDQRKVSYFRNGVACGVAFTEMPKDVFLYPACSLKR